MNRLKMDYSDTTIIVPTLNEGKNISELITEVTNKYKGIHIIISDDGSKDRTQNIVKRFSKKNKSIILVDRTEQKVHGLTVSVLDAVTKITSDFIVVMDGDLQHPPGMIAEIVQRLRSGKEIVVGVRVNTKYENIFRFLMSKTAIILGRCRLLLGGVYCNDVVSGFFGIRTNLFNALIKRYEKAFEKEGYKVLFDILKLAKPDIGIGEVPYEFQIRMDGKSKIRARHVLLYFRSLFR